jgi:hypothetical protein
MKIGGVVIYPGLRVRPYLSKESIVVFLQSMLVVLLHDRGM